MRGVFFVCFYLNVLSGRFESIIIFKNRRSCLVKTQSFQFQVWDLPPEQVPSFCLSAIWFGDHCPKTRITGLDTGQAQEGRRQEKRAIL